MKKIIITIVSAFYMLSGYCQSKALYLKSKELIKFQTWDTIYAIKSKGNRVILRDKKGKKYNCELDTQGSEFVSPIEISEHGRYHIHGNHKQGVGCHSGIIVMGNNMKLFFKDNCKVRSNHYDHGSHMSHASHYSSRM
ncbi:MAG: hypothetical protein IJ898_04625 [Prevotella sp.]|nr:hypothetical protein [Prevotella sp.]